MIANQRLAANRAAPPPSPARCATGSRARAVHSPRRAAPAATRAARQSRPPAASAPRPRRLKAQPRLPALHAQIFLLVARLAHLRVQPLAPRAPAQPGSLPPAPCWLRALPASVSRCIACRRVASKLPLRGEHLLRGRARFLLPRLHLLAKRPRLAGRRLQKRVLLRPLFGNPAQLRPRLLQLRWPRPRCAPPVRLTRSVLARSRAVARSSSTAASLARLCASWPSRSSS